MGKIRVTGTTCFKDVSYNLNRNWSMINNFYSLAALTCTWCQSCSIINKTRWSVTFKITELMWEIVCISQIMCTPMLWQNHMRLFQKHEHRRATGSELVVWATQMEWELLTHSCFTEWNKSVTFAFGAISGFQSPSLWWICTSALFFSEQQSLPCKSNYYKSGKK